MINIIKFIKKYQIILIYFIFSLIIRLFYGSNYVTFSQDVARDNLIITKYQESKTYIVGYGPKASVYDFYLPPFYYQLHLIASLLTDNYPLVMKYLITIVESITPVILFAILVRILPIWKSYLLSLIYLFSSLVLSISVNAWNPNMIPFFSSLALLSWVKVTLDRSWQWIVVGILATTLAIQLHYQAVVLVPFVIFINIWLFLNNKKIWKYILIGIFLSFLTMLPYLLIEINNEWHNTKQIINYFSLEHRLYFDQVSKINYLISFIPSFLQRVLMGYHYNLLIGRLIFVAGILFILVDAIKKKKISLLLGFYFLTILFMLRVYKGDKLDYYMSTLFILPPILLAYIWKYLKNKVYVIGIFILLIYSGIYLGKSGQFNDLAVMGNEQQQIKEIVADKQFRILFHNDDQINKYAYILNNINSLDQKNGKYVLEVCDNLSECKPQKRSICIHNRGYSYANMLRNTFRSELVYYNPQSRFVLSYFQDTINPLAYKSYEYDNAYGIDTVFPQAYSWY